MEHILLGIFRIVRYPLGRTRCVYAPVKPGYDYPILKVGSRLAREMSVDLGART